MYYFMIIVFSGCLVVSALMSADALCGDYRSVCSCFTVNLEVNSAAEISSGS